MQHETYDIIMDTHNLQMPCCSKICTKRELCSDPVCRFHHRNGFLRQGLMCAKSDGCSDGDCLMNHPAQLARYQKQIKLLSSSKQKEKVPLFHIMLKFICMNNQKSFYLNLSVSLTIQEITDLIKRKELIIGPLETKLFFKNVVVDRFMRLKQLIATKKLRNGEKFTFSWMIKRCKLLHRVTFEHVVSKKQYFGYLTPEARLEDLQSFIVYCGKLMVQPDRLRFTCKAGNIESGVSLLKDLKIKTGDWIYWFEDEDEEKEETKMDVSMTEAPKSKRRMDKIAIKKSRARVWDMRRKEGKQYIGRLLYPKIKAMAYSYANEVTKELVKRKDLDVYDLAYLLHDEDELIRIVKKQHKHSVLYTNYQ